METKYNSEGLLLCPICNVAMLYDDVDGRDTETMSGDSVEYFICNTCGRFEVISGTTAPSD